MARCRFLSGLGLYCACTLLSMQAAPQAHDAARAARAAAQARTYTQANQHRIVGELLDLLRIPNVAADTPNIQRNASKLLSMLEQRGVHARLLPIPGRGPVVFGELTTPGATRAIVFYCHYDGQPVDESRWTNTKPFEPALLTDTIHAGGKLIPFPSAPAPFQDSWRVYARSASDDKSPIVAILTAIDALRAGKIALATNVKFIFEGEEEDGSSNLETTLLAHRELLKGDLLIAADGPVHQTGRLQIVFGNRGIMDVEITVYGPYRALHSGHYGNWAPNPAQRLSELLATMKDRDGHVLVEGFYDDVAPLTEAERRSLAEFPRNEPDLLREFGFAVPEGDGKSLLDLINLPSLNVNGLRSGYVGAERRTSIPDRAIASLDLRLVRNVQPAKQFERLVAHIGKQSFHVTSEEPTAEERAKYPRIARVRLIHGYPAARTSLDTPVAQALVRTVEAAVGGPVFKLPTLGGSAPMYIWENLELPVAIVPIVNHDNNQHSENENLRLGNFWRGIEIFAAILADLNW